MPTYQPALWSRSALALFVNGGAEKRATTVANQVSALRNNLNGRERCPLWE